MPPGFKTKKHLKLVFVFTCIVLFGAWLVFMVRGKVWTQYDDRALDFFYRLAVKQGLGPKASFTPRIVYLLVTDETYDFFGSNSLDRKDLARVNRALHELSPEAVVYDIIFARGSTPKADKRFADSLELLDKVYLPSGFSLRNEPVRFTWEQGHAYARLRSDYLGKPKEKGISRPYYAREALLQYDDLAMAASGSGDISAVADPDGVYRQVPLLIKIDERYFPSLSLAVFLDWAGLALEQLRVEWGKRITIPSTGNSHLDEEVHIPIDERGRVSVPFVDRMGRDFPTLAVHDFLGHFEHDDLRGNLAGIFEGNFVLISDASAGVSDLGYTPLEKNVSMVTFHASLLNAMLTNTFYRKWSVFGVLGVISLLCIILVAAASLKGPWFIYGTGPLLVGLSLAFTWWEFVHFRLFPVAAVGCVVLVHFVGLVATLEIATSREKTFIRNTFAKYVPEKVVHQLLARPEALRLGGEERVLTILFSDLADFTTLSEGMFPTDLVALLNEYLSEMTDIVIHEGGIIDKYQGDAIMPEFGVPLPLPDHADRAVEAALSMQQRLSELRKTWRPKGLPLLRCRVGINTGSMVVGNIGSRKVLDYTVIGDAVNLASRLEGANKSYGTGVMISESTYENLTPGRFLLRPLDIVQVRGKTQWVKVYEAYGRQGDYVAPDQERYYRVYTEALEAFLVRDFQSARHGFLKALSVRPKDSASTLMLKKISNDT
ncbi:MAG: adenylate/guanylate cyclase domain-containing protein [Desulfohalobiaceae bacterium]|nr:adenylate/guanylate cyclase domain-containing protein [Desulfohalobiaceae bacterium]